MRSRWPWRGTTPCKSPPIWSCRRRPSAIASGPTSLDGDILSRVAFGARTSLSYAMLATSISLAPGTAIGVSTAFYAGRFDNVVMRIVDVLMVFPGIMLGVRENRLRVRPCRALTVTEGPNALSRSAGRAPDGKNRTSTF